MNFRHFTATLATTALALVMLLGSSAFAVERVALVIGNGDYVSAGSLKNARNDAREVAGALSRLGFRVIKGLDTDQDEMRRLVQGFSREVETASIALFYYAGHALQINGRNHLMPVDARLERESDLDFETLDIDVVLRQMERHTGTSIVLLDACRNNPLATKLASAMGQRSASVGKGLAPIESGLGSFIGFATQPDNVAYDGKGTHSPFTSALLAHIETPGLDIEVMMRRVREEVIEATAGRQVPWSNSSLIGDRVVLSPAGDVADDKPASDVEITYWNSVKDSGNPNLLRAYLNAYPDGSFSTLARTMLAEAESVDRTRPAIILGPPPTEPAPAEPQMEALGDSEPDGELRQAAPAVDAEAPDRAPPPIARKKPQPPKKVSAPKREPKKTPAKKTPAKRAPARAAVSPAPQAKDCDYCYGCESLIPTCRRKWVCGKRYSELLAAGLCRR